MSRAQVEEILGKATSVDAVIDYQTLNYKDEFRRQLTDRECEAHGRSSFSREPTGLLKQGPLPIAFQVWQTRSFPEGASW